MDYVAEIPWNVVTKNLHGHELLRKKLSEKVAKLGKHLARFPHDAVHLHIALEGHAKKPLYIAALTLRVPSNILRAEKTAADIITAFDDAVRTLLRELRTFKARLRREAEWKPAARRAELHARKAGGFTTLPQPEGVGPQNLGDIVCELIARHYAELLRHARRLIEHETLAGELPDGAIDSRAVVAEVTRRALAGADGRPPEIGWLPWFFRLVFEELQRRREAIDNAPPAISLETCRVLPEDAEAAAGYEPERPLDIIEEKLEPPVVELREVLADQRTIPPDVELARRDLLDHIQHAIQRWPRAEREVFELHFVEGFEADEIAMVCNREVNEICTMLEKLQHRLRAEFLESAR